MSTVIKSNLSAACRIFIIVIGVVLSSSVNAATETSVDRTKGKTAVATFLSNNGCYTAIVEIDAYESLQKGNLPPKETAMISLFEYDTCNGYLITKLALGEGNILDFKTFGNIDGATLKTEIMVTDWLSGLIYPISVNLTWTGSTALASSMATNTTQAPGYLQKYQYSGVFRGAQATGTITDGSGVNYASELVSGYLLKVNQGILTITHF